MHNLAILSRDSTRYQKLIEDAHSPHLQLVLIASEIAEPFDYSQVHILFGDPNLTAQVVSQCTELKWYSLPGPATLHFLP